MVAAILFMTFFGFNNEGFYFLLIFVSVCGGGSYFVVDFVQNGYPLPPMLISRGMEMYEDIKVYFKKNCIEKLVFYI